ncbi:MAG TPA: SDR family oxidoreductase [Acidobacteriaceae bacterium]|nr:SDR family oxidoreductase [Acidobacteriaceae bacterium]
MHREGTLSTEIKLIDPRKRFAVPPFPETKQNPPGSSNDLKPPADYGELSYIGAGKLAGRAALITGADSGIGRAVALCFAKEDADVLFAHLPEEEDDAKETVRLVKAAGRNAVAVAGDIRSKAFCEKLVEEVFRTYGRLDVLINNAAFQRTYEKLEEIPEEEFDRTFRTNVYATFFLTQAALPRMQPGGVVLNTCSIEAYQPDESLVAYAATKFALVSLTKSFAKLAMKSGVRVNGIAPGPVWTPLIPATMPGEKVKTFGSNTAFGRPAMPVEQAAVFVFLASDDASYVTGEVYGATGGKTPF